VRELGRMTCAHAGQMNTELTSGTSSPALYAIGQDYAEQGPRHCKRASLFWLSHVSLRSGPFFIHGGAMWTFLLFPSINVADAKAVLGAVCRFTTAGRQISLCLFEDRPELFGRVPRVAHSD